MVHVAVLKAPCPTCIVHTGLVGTVSFAGNYMER